ncbi:E3 ubiquitin-protein ligase TRIM71 [Patella vulgata]|uniref:E3 ubiquitin-protein ligase TRIM71 n=1 Tax=Patella vulgata TaxID=6465 RepID=UPI00217FFDA8|nr:E3 ubiquitin-protein ligase TRIM71 [Patella vulgata]XP_050390565.1 E3 ubiquitin-protein ligase TRIM71 [Patella vulgata]
MADCIKQARSPTTEQSRSPKAELTCGLCYKDLNKPKQLACCHTFCRHCLEDYVRDTLNAESQTIDCPKCQKVIQIPENGTKGLPSNYHILAQSLSDEIDTGAAFADFKCDICKVNKVIGYCFECTKNLCEEDKNKHKTAPVSRSHHIATFTDGNRKVEKDSYCEKHSDNILKFYCCQCSVPICSDCKLAKHENHRTEDIEDVAFRDRERLSKLMEILRQYLPCMNDAVNSAENAEAAFKNHANDTIECINHRREEVKKLVDQLCDGAVNYVRGKLEAELQCMVPKLNDIKEDRKFIERSINITEPVINMGEDVKIVEVTKDIQNIVNNLPEPKRIDEKKFIFNAGVHGQSLMCKYVGTIGFEAKALKHDFSFDNNNLFMYSIIPVSETEAWMSYYNSEESAIIKVNNYGKEIEKFSLQPFGRYRMIMLENDEFLLSSYGEKKLKILRNYKESLFAETPFEPQGIVKTADNNILVCCSDDVETEDENTERALLMFSQRGTLLKRVDSRLNEKEKLFNSPKYVCVNINGDVCISDEDGKAILIFNKDLKLIGRYEGCKNTNPFRPRGICCDRFGRIIVTDGDNHKIHLLSSSGEFIRYLLTEEDGVRGPVLVAIGPGNKLWVTCKGLIQIYSYLDGAGLLSRPTSPKCVK